MTTDEIEAYYSGLLILQYLGLPRASATIEALVKPVLINQMPIAVQNAYNLDGTSVGVQLDILGKYVGVSRSGVDTNPSSPTYGNTIVLIDKDYFQLIKLVIIRNNLGSSLADIQNFLQINFPGQIFVSDSSNMQITYTIIESVGTSNLLTLLQTGNYFPKPMGVNTAIISLPVFTSPIFGFRTYSAPNVGAAPFNTYVAYRPLYHWLSYQDAI